jgi:hypothetical protein
VRSALVLLAAEGDPAAKADARLALGRDRRARVAGPQTGSAA